MLRWQNCLMHFWPEKIGRWHHCSFLNSKMEIWPLQCLSKSKMRCNRNCSINTINSENIHISWAVNHETCKTKGSPLATAQWAAFCPPCSVDSLQVDSPPAPSRVSSVFSLCLNLSSHSPHTGNGAKWPSPAPKGHKNESGREDDR